MPCSKHLLHFSIIWVIFKLVSHLHRLLQNLVKFLIQDHTKSLSPSFQLRGDHWHVTVGENKMENISSTPSWQRECLYLFHGSFQTLNMRRIGGLQGGNILNNLVHRLVHCSANFQAHVRLPVRSRTAKRHFQDSVQVKIYLVLVA